jgi:hypothetical protein
VGLSAPASGEALTMEHEFLEYLVSVGFVDERHELR